MSNYIDAFILPVPQKHLTQYKNVAEKVAQIWKEYGAIAYYEYVGDDLQFEGTQSFPETINAIEGDVIIFGWVVFPSKKVRDVANKKVPLDKRMNDIIAPLIHPSNIIFNASKMVYGGFQPLVSMEGTIVKNDN